MVSYVNVSDIRREDGGLYRCEATNEAGRSYHEDIIFISGPPFIRNMGNISVLSGESFTLRCPVSGHPFATKITWKRGFRYFFLFRFFISLQCKWKRICSPFQSNELDGSIFLDQLTITIIYTVR